MRGPDSHSSGSAEPEPTEDQRKSAEEWQLAQWQRWPRHEMWPGKMDLYLAAAYVTISPATLRRLAVTDRSGKAAMPHQRFGAAFRFDRRDLDAHGRVESQ